jgi:hypothetical protein
MRLALAALAILLAANATAQTPPGSPTAPANASPEVARASRALAAMWRPLTGPATETALASACHGAVEDMRALDEAMPDPLTSEALASLHPAHGIVFVPASDDPGAIFIFPSADLIWFASGLGAIAAANEGTGEVSLRDAAGHTIQAVLGHAAGHAMLRLEVPGGGPATYVGCAATAN